MIIKSKSRRFVVPNKEMPIREFDNQAIFG